MHEVPCKTKRTGEWCKCSSKQSWTVCRLHDAFGGGPSGAAHPNNMHGTLTKQMMTARSLVSILSKAAGALHEGRYN